MATEYTLHQRIGFKVTHLARIMESRLEKQLSVHGVTRLQWCVLRGVGLEGVTSPSQLADYIRIARPAVSRLLKSMEEQGLVKRNGLDDDKRFTAVELTDLGQEKLTACHGLVRELNQHFSGKLDVETYDMFMAAIDRLTEGEDVQLTRL